MKLLFQSLACILPGYAILGIAVVRSVFVALPLRHAQYTRPHLQLRGAMVAFLLAALLVALPFTGLCSATVTKVRIATSVLHVCAYETDCHGFGGIFLAVGICAPLLTTCCLYLYIYRLALAARRTHSRLTESGTTSSASYKSGITNHCTSNAALVTEAETCSKAGHQVTNDGELGRLEKEKREEEKNERWRVPWSLLATVAMSLLTTLPWAVIQLKMQDLTQLLAADRTMAVVYDAMYATLLVLVGVSPLVYILTTNSLRQPFCRTLTRWHAKWCINRVEH